MNEYQAYRTNRASLRPQMPEDGADYFALSTGISPDESLSAASVRAAMGLFASICGENYSADDILFVGTVKYYPAF